MALVRIKVIPKDNQNLPLFAASLKKNALSRLPGTYVRQGPYREADGRYRTGLDENAQYIRELSQEEQEIEKKRVKELREKLEYITTLDLGPTSPYYSKPFDDDITHSSQVKFGDKDILFDTEEPGDNLDAGVYGMITLAWVMVHPLVARSLADYKAGKAHANAGWYISDPEGETAEEYAKEMAVNKAKETLNKLNAPQLRRMARLLELPINEDSTQEHTYLLLSKELQKSSISFGAFKGRKPVDVFNELAALTEETLRLKDLVRQSIRLSIYRKQGLAVMNRQGTEKIADSENDLVAQLAASAEEAAALEKKVKDKLTLQQTT
jgi:hypothetical protein